MHVQACRLQPCLNILHRFSKRQFTFKNTLEALYISSQHIPTTPPTMSPKHLTDSARHIRQFKCELFFFAGLSDARRTIGSKKHSFEQIVFLVSGRQAKQTKKYLMFQGTYPRNVSTTFQKLDRQCPTHPTIPV